MTVQPNPIQLTRPPETNDSDWFLAKTDEITTKVRAARAAQVQWAELDISARAEFVNRVADSLLERSTEIAERITEHTGKQPVEAIAHEVMPSVLAIRWLCKNAQMILGPKHTPLAAMPTRVASIERVPVGLALVISPWNFPLSIPMGQVAAGLVAGNAVILKPSEVTPAVGEIIEELIQSAGLPAGLFSVIQGDGRVGARLIDEHPDKVFFTGSLATGKKVMASAAQYPIPVCLELGGVDAMIVCDDADIELASSAAAWGSMFNGGQVCASVERVLVQESVKDHFMAALESKIARLDSKSDLGPIIFENQRRIYDAHMKDARERELNIRCGGQPISQGVFAPTIIDGADIEDAAVYREETFGPLLTIHSFAQDEDAARLHNDSEFGLTASVFSKDRGRAESLSRKLRAGLVSINDVASTLFGHAELPWGGVAGSGFGRSHGEEGLLEFTWSRVIERSRPGVPEFKRPWWFPYDETQRELLQHFAFVLGSRDLKTRVAHAGELGRSFISLFTHTPRL